MATSRIQDLDLGSSIHPVNDHLAVDVASANETRRTTAAQIAKALGIPSSTVAGLPGGLPATGPMRFCTDGRKAGEGAGLGTGQLAIKVSGAWLSVDEGTTVVA